jgi:hypothetical protein
MSGGAKNMASMFEKKAEDTLKPVTNAKQGVVRSWTPDNQGAHTTVGYSVQTKAEASGPPKKRSIADLP